MPKPLPDDWPESKRELWDRYCFARETAERIHKEAGHAGDSIKACIECKSGFALLLMGPDPSILTSKTTKRDPGCQDA